MQRAGQPIWAKMNWHFGSFNCLQLSNHVRRYAAPNVAAVKYEPLRQRRQTGQPPGPNYANRRGCFEADPYESFGLNSITATPDRSGIATLLLPSDDHGLQNFAHVMGGWDYELRLHQPHQSVLDTTWTPPTPEPANWNPRNRAP